jgi:23S rRNA (cytosine1962-C5)-methyltransferase
MKAGLAEHMMKSIRLHPGREKPLIRKHPWIFASAIREIHGQPELGDVVEVVSNEGQWLALAAYSPHSKIRARIWSWDPSEEVGADLIGKRIDAAIERRARFFALENKSAFREFFAESDGIPGLIIDRYNDVRVLQILSAGTEYWRDEILQHLISRGDCSSIYERSDVDVRRLEGLEERTGHLWGEEPTQLIQIEDGKQKLAVDVRKGHKTGFYLDQSENRASFSKMINAGDSVLDCFSYTGAFSVAGLKSGAENALLIDSSGASLEIAKHNFDLNGMSDDQWEAIQGDAFEVLRKLRDQNRKFDIVVLDPPKFAATPSHIQRASRGYKDINMLGIKLLHPGGLLFTFSCSGGVSPELFQKIVADAALDAGRQAAVVKWLGQPADHPVALEFPEGRYLKGLVCRVE